MHSIGRIVTVAFLVAIATGVVLSGYTHAFQRNPKPFPTADFEFMLDQTSLTLGRGQVAVVTGTIVSKDATGRFYIYPGSDETRFNAASRGATNIPSWIAESVTVDPSQLDLNAGSKGTITVIIRLANAAPLNDQTIFIDVAYDAGGGFFLSRGVAIHLTVTS